MSLLAASYSASYSVPDVSTQHLPSGVAWPLVAVLAVLAVVWVVKKVVTLALLAALVAVGIALYHQGVLDRLTS